MLSLLSAIRQLLQAKYSKPERAGKEFILPEIAGDILAREHVRELLRHFQWYRENDRDNVWPSMRLILCILATIQFNQWHEFKNLFFESQPRMVTPRYVDTDSPIEDVSFLPEGVRDRFKRDQYLFCPIIIEEDSHERYTEEHRLPISKIGSIEGGGGGFGKVEKVFIEKHCLKYANGDDDNKNVRVMALKTARNTKEAIRGFEAERRNLRDFKKSLSRNQHIALNFASFIQGECFMILLPYADLDLYKILCKPSTEILDLAYRFTPQNPKAKPLN